MNNKKSGFTTFFSLLFFCSLSCVLFSITLLITSSNRRIVAEDEKINQRDIIGNVFLLVADKIYKDLQNKTENSRFDELWEFNNTEIENCKVIIQSDSGLINLYNMPIGFLKSEKIRNILSKYDTTVCDGELDVFTNVGRLFWNFDLLVSESDKKHDFFFFTPLNLNTIDPIFFREFIKRMELDDSIYWKKKQLFVNNQFLRDDVEALFCYGLEYDRLKKIFILDGIINVNFATEQALELILNYEEFAIKNVDAKIKSLMEIRQRRAITKKDICMIFGISDNDKLFYYLGVKSSIWKIIIEGKYEKCIYEIFINNSSIYKVNEQWISL